MYMSRAKRKLKAVDKAKPKLGYCSTLKWCKLMELFMGYLHMTGPGLVCVLYTVYCVLSGPGLVCVLYIVYCTLYTVYNLN